MKLAYMMSRFPKLTETFILNEIVALKQQGIDVEILPLIREKTSIMHPDAQRLLPEVQFKPWLSVSIISDNLYWLITKPLRYLTTIGRVITGNWRCQKFLWRGLALLPKTMSFARTIQQQHITHIHAHFASHPALAAWIIHRMTHIGYSFTAHGSDLHVHQSMLLQKYQSASFVAMVSRYNQHFFQQSTGVNTLEKLPLIRCGILPELFQPKRGYQSHNPLKIVCVASLRKVKGHVFLIDACARLQQQGYDFECHLVGDGPERSGIQQRIAQHQLQAKVILRGNMTQPEVKQILSEADIFALTSCQTSAGNREGIPVVLMEAMACALPCVSVQLSGIPELISHEQDGLLATPEDSHDIAVQLKRLMDNVALRQQLGGNARVKVESEFNQHTHIATLIDLFQQLHH